MSGILIHFGFLYIYRTIFLCVLDEGAPWGGDLNLRQLSGRAIVEVTLGI